MPRTVLVGVGLKAIRHARRVVLVADRARHAGCTAAAGVTALPRFFRVLLENPPTVVTTPAAHRYPIAGESSFLGSSPDQHLEGGEDQDDNSRDQFPIRLRAANIRRQHWGFFSGAPPQNHFYDRNDRNVIGTS
jgi:hypothetical protein